jgi:hypothetical protein
MKADAYSDSFPINDIVKGIDNNYKPGDSNFVFALAEVGADYNGFILSLLWRYDAYIDLAKDSDRVIFLSESDEDIPAGKHYQIDLSANQIRSRGLRAGFKQHVFKQLEITTSLQWLESYEMTDGSIKGYIDTYEDDYQGQLHLDYVYTEDHVWDREVDEVNGQGFAVDFAIAWQINSQHRLQLNLLDVYHKIRWENMYYTESDLTTERINYDEDGKLDVRSAMTGYEGNKDYRQSLPMRSYVTWQYQQHSGASINTEIFTVADDYVELRLAYQPALLNHWQFSISSAKALGVSYQNSYFGFLLATDQLDYKKAQSLQFGLKLNYPF